MFDPQVVFHVDQKKPGAVRIDRSTPWGNPYRIGIDGNRDEVCDRFEAYATKRSEEDPEWLKPLKGRLLECHCAPKRCHGETLWRLANEVRET